MFIYGAHHHGCGSFFVIFQKKLVDDRKIKTFEEEFI